MSSSAAADDDRRQQKPVIQASLAAGVTRAPDYILPLLILGAKGSGKSELVECLRRGGGPLLPRDESASEPGGVAPTRRAQLLSTVGVDFCTITWLSRGLCVKLLLYDTAGSELYEHIATSYINMAHAYLFVCDGSDRDGLQRVETWIQRVRRRLNDSPRESSRPPPAYVLACSKCDSPEGERAISSQAIADASECLELSHCEEVSAYQGKGVLELIEWIVDDYVARARLHRIASSKVSKLRKQQQQQRKPRTGGSPRKDKRLLPPSPLRATASTSDGEDEEDEEYDEFCGCDASRWTCTCL